MFKSHLTKVKKTNPVTSFKRNGLCWGGLPWAFGGILLGAALATWLVAGGVAAENRSLKSENYKLRQAKTDFYAAHSTGVSDQFIAQMTSQDIHKVVNASRDHNGLAPLGYEPLLETSACAKADDMIASNYWSHNTPDGKQPWVFMTNSGVVYRTAGENLGYGFNNGDSQLTGWLNSPTHKANIMSTAFTAEGICVRKAALYQGAPNQMVVVQHFYSPL